MASLTAELEGTRAANAVLEKTKTDWEVLVCSLHCKHLSRIGQSNSPSRECVHIIPAPFPFHSLTLTSRLRCQKRAVGWQKRSKDYDAAMTQMRSEQVEMQMRVLQLETRNREIETVAATPMERWKVEAIVDKAKPLSTLHRFVLSKTVLSARRLITTATVFWTRKRSKSL